MSPSDVLWWTFAAVCVFLAAFVVVALVASAYKALRPEPVEVPRLNPGTEVTFQQSNGQLLTLFVHSITWANGVTTVICSNEWENRRSD